MSGLEPEAPLLAAGCWLQWDSPNSRPHCIVSQFHSFLFYLQELTWTQILGHPWSASSSACGSGRNSLRTFYNQRQSLSSPCPTSISRHRDVSPGERAGIGSKSYRSKILGAPPLLFSWPSELLSLDLTDISDHPLGFSLGPPDLSPS